MYKHQREDFIETNLLTALDEQWDQYTDSLNTSHEEFEKYCKRLQVVRQEKEKARLEFLGTPFCANTLNDIVFGILRFGINNWHSIKHYNKYYYFMTLM